VKAPFCGGFGLLAGGGIPKPAFNAFALLHRLGDPRLAVNSDSALATRRADGSLAIALWNLFLPEETGAPKKVTVRLKGFSRKRQARVWLVDPDHGSPLPAYERMGRPRFPTREQFEALRKAAALPAAESSSITGGTISLTLQPHALALIEIQ